MRQIDIFGTTATAPATWNEMTAAQCAHILKVFAAPVAFANSPDEAYRWKQIQIFKALTDITDEQIEMWQTAAIQDNPEDGFYIFLEELQAKCDEITQDLVTTTEGVDGAPNQYGLAPTLTENPYKSIEIFEIKKEKQIFHTFYAPKTSADSPLSILTLDELSQVFTLWEAYRDEKDEKDFNEMLAILYRPKKPNKDRMKSNYNGDIRQKLEENETLIQARAQLMGEHVSDNFRIVIDFHIASCRETIAKMYPSVFGRKEGLKTGQTGDWLDLIIALADDDFSKRDNVLDANAHDSLAWADRTREKMKANINAEAVV